MHFASDDARRAYFLTATDDVAHSLTMILDGLVNGETKGDEWLAMIANAEHRLSLYEECRHAMA